MTDNKAMDVEKVQMKEMNDNQTNEPAEENIDIPDYTVRRDNYVGRQSLAPSAVSEQAVDDEEGEQSKDDKDSTVFNRRLMIAGGFLDIALFTSNCDQLKAILEIKWLHDHYELVLGLISTSLILQVIAGFTMFVVGCISIKNPSDRRRADILNHITMGLVTLITIVNIFISSFTVKGDFFKSCALSLSKTNPPAF